MPIEVKLEQLIMDTFPTIKVEEPSVVGGVRVEVWSGKLADLVAAILGETSPGYSPYQED